MKNVKENPINLMYNNKILDNMIGADFDKYIKPVLDENEKIIAGPCSAESADQVLETAKQLSEQGVKIFRAGVWKPRTQPGGFEGLGSVAIPWLKKVKEKYGMKIAIEVANETQAEIALDNDIDIIWIGARTTTDPFAVQSIADTINQYNAQDKVAVLIKNPVCPDYKLWEGAVRRIANIGVKRIGCVFRGFKTYTESYYRNEPIWSIAVKMMTEHPNLQMILDPSHITGDRNKINQIVREGLLTYNMDGVMIECHCDPVNAWTDAKQQIKPENLSIYLNTSDFFGKSIGTINDMSDEDKEKLDNYRRVIKKGDQLIIDLIMSRLAIAKEIGELKKKYNIPVLNETQWNKVIDNVKETTKLHIVDSFDKNSLKNDYFLYIMMQNIYEQIHSASIKIQEN